MCFYHTSENIKILHKLIKQFEETPDMTPHEYMKDNLLFLSNNFKEKKSEWFVETFLSLHKHIGVFNGVAESYDFEGDQKYYFSIMLHAIVFCVTVMDNNKMFKCLFNLDKEFLNKFSATLTQDHCLQNVSKTAQGVFDASYVTIKIMEPLILWLPHLSDMNKAIVEYENEIKRKNIKPPTVPDTLNVLNYPPRSKKQPCVTPETTTREKPLIMKMLTKSTIDKKLKAKHEENVKKAKAMLKNNKKPRARIAVTESKEEKMSPPQEVIKPKVIDIKKTPAVPIKETITSIKRLDKLVQIQEQKELKWLENALGNKIMHEDFESESREENEKQRLEDIEKKHLDGLISHEQAVIAKRKLIEKNKKICEDLVKEKENWHQAIEEWKLKETEKHRELVEKMTIDELSRIESKAALENHKKEVAVQMKKDFSTLRENALKVQKEELERRISIIKEMKALSLVMKESKMPKVLDLTESSGLGLLSEMSIAELQERLAALKINLTDEIERKRKCIEDKKQSFKKDFEETKKNLQIYLDDKTRTRELSKNIKTAQKQKLVTLVSSSQEIAELKKKLEEKRSLRLNLNRKL